MSIHSGSCNRKPPTGACKQQNVILADVEAGKSETWLAVSVSWGFLRGPARLGSGGSPLGASEYNFPVVVAVP